MSSLVFLAAPGAFGRVGRLMSQRPDSAAALVRSAGRPAGLRPGLSFSRLKPSGAFVVGFVLVRARADLADQARLVNG